ncbi:MAG: biotin--[acetyl-CoA-carboxylase] ligase [Bacteroidetes bacterium]|nr:MAG: biotin--[acetyl-CoA-carboxylase] ligase [Bacteroidota bacterium]
MRRLVLHEAYISQSILVIFACANRVPRTRFIFAVMLKRGIEYRHFQSIASTNAMASSVLESEKIEHYLVLSTDTQTKGRGQQGTTWQDFPGENLLMTLITPSISWPAARVFDLNMAISLAILQALKPHLPVQLKWPNDIWVSGKKMAGLLIEPVVRGGYVQRLVVGLGLNVNQTQFDSSLNATSLVLECGKPFDLSLVRESISESIQSALTKILQTGVSPKKEYLNSCVAYARIGKYRSGDQEFTALFSDIDNHGRQILLHSDGSKHAYDLKEVKYLP